MRHSTRFLVTMFSSFRDKLRSVAEVIRRFNVSFFVQELIFLCILLFCLSYFPRDIVSLFAHSLNSKESAVSW